MFNVESICTALGLTLEWGKIKQITFWFLFFKKLFDGVFILYIDIFDAKEQLQTTIAELWNFDLNSLQKSASDMKFALDVSAKKSSSLADFFEQLNKRFNELVEVKICRFVTI